MESTREINQLLGTSSQQRERVKLMQKIRLTSSFFTYFPIEKVYDSFCIILFWSQTLPIITNTFHCLKATWSLKSTIHSFCCCPIYLPQRAGSVPVRVPGGHRGSWPKCSMKLYWHFFKPFWWWQIICRMSLRHWNGEWTFDVDFRMFHIYRWISGVRSREEMKGRPRRRTLVDRVAPWCHHESTDWFQSGGVARNG